MGLIELIFTGLGFVVFVIVVIVAVSASKKGAVAAAAGEGPYAAGAKAMSDALAGLGYVQVPGAAGGTGIEGDAATTAMQRTVEGRTLRWTSSTLRTGTGATQVSMRWTLGMQTPATVPFHVASASLGALTGHAKDALMGRTRRFSPRYPAVVPLQGTALDGQLCAFSPPGYEATVAERLQEPALLAALAVLSHVDLHVDGDAVHFDDPFQDVLMTLMGGPLGMMQLFQPAGLQKLVWMHEAIAQALCRAADQAR